MWYPLQNFFYETYTALLNNIAKGSLAELRTQLVIINEIEYINDMIFQEFDEKCNEIGRMLGSLIKKRKG